MSTGFKQYRDIAIVTALLVVPFFFLRANMKRPENMSAIDRVFLRISAPVQYSFATLARGLTHTWHSYVYLVDVKEDHDRLRYENARLKESVRKLESARGENLELKRLLSLRETTPAELVSAVVVQKDFNEYFRVATLVLDRGTRGIGQNMPVIAPDGVVGKVLSVAGDLVQVQLSVDALFGVDVEDVRTKARGYVRGTGDRTKYYCRVENVDARDELEEGDLLVTSGKGKLFPQGIPVARVSKVVKRGLGRDQEVEAVPTVNFSRLETVLVMLSAPEESVSRPKER